MGVLKLAISGCREYGDVCRFRELMGRVMAQRFPGHVLVGDCPTGIDSLVRDYVPKMMEGVRPSITVYRADWDAHGRSAGPIRNREMAERCDALVAFWNGSSPGTLNMIQQAIRLGKPVEIVPLRELFCCPEIDENQISLPLDTQDAGY